MICGDRATKLRYSHYGATSCFSCRAFFRRAVEKNSHFNYACAGGNCAITVSTRKKCPHCRYQKCKMVGMSHNSNNNSPATTTTRSPSNNYHKEEEDECKDSNNNNVSANTVSGALQ